MVELAFVLITAWFFNTMLPTNTHTHKIHTHMSIGGVITVGWVFYYKFHEYPLF